MPIRFVTIRSRLARFPWDGWLVLAWFVAGYFFYRCVVGTPFDTRIQFDMHFLPHPLLATDLLRSLFYLHSQPPLLNIYAAFALRLWPSHYASVLEAMCILGGMAALAFMTMAMVTLGIHRAVRLAIMLPLCTLPALFLYQAWPFSPQLEFLFCAMLAYYFSTLCMQRRGLAGIFIACCLLGLLHARWHVGMFALLAIVMTLLEGRRVLRASLLCLVPLTLWYGKNLVLFGFFGASSWMGTNVVDVAKFCVSPSELASLQSSGTLSPDFPAIYDFAKVLHRAPLATMPPNLHPALTVMGGPNYNYLGIITSADQDLRDAMTIIRLHPMCYLLTVADMLKNVLWWPSTAFAFLPGLPQVMQWAGLADAPNPSYYTLPEGVRQVMQEGSFILYACIPLSLLALMLLPRRYTLHAPGWRHFIFYAFCLSEGILAVACFTNRWEQERMRWGLEPFYLILAALLLETLLRQCRRYLR